MKNTSPSPELKRAIAYVGIFSRVATRLGLTPGHVRQVALGRRISERVADALTREVKRIERESERAA